MNHKRVIPRDFFNESKLLKCLGKFEIAVTDKRCGGLDIRTYFDHLPFVIYQNESDGGIYCANYKVWLQDEWIDLYIPYNSKDELPLIGRYREVDYYIFDKQGKWMPNFGVINADQTSD